MGLSKLDLKVLIRAAIEQPGKIRPGLDRFSKG